MRHAQGWPQKNIRLIVPAPAGSAPDLAARLIADKLSRTLGQPVLIDNRPGAGGIIAMNALKAAAPDGYTLAFAQAAVVVVTPFTYKEASYDMDRDFDTVAMVGRTPMMFVANTSHPAKTLGDALAQAKARPDTMSDRQSRRAPRFRTWRPKLASMKSDARFQQISFANTAPGHPGRRQRRHRSSTSTASAPLLPLVKAGKLRAIAVASETALPGLEGISAGQQDDARAERLRLVQPAGAQGNAGGHPAAPQHRGQPGACSSRTSSPGSASSAPMPRRATVAEAARFVKSEKRHCSAASSARWA